MSPIRITIITFKTLITTFPEMISFLKRFQSNNNSSLCREDFDKNELLTLTRISSCRCVELAINSSGVAESDVQVCSREDGVQKKPLSCLGIVSLQISFSFLRTLTFYLPIFMIICNLSMHRHFCMNWLK